MAMTHDELVNAFMGNPSTLAVIELHKPMKNYCSVCLEQEYSGEATLAEYPCATIQAIAKQSTPNLAE